MQSLGRILSSIQFKGPGPLQSRQILTALVRLVGEQPMRAVRLGTLRAGTLTLEVASAAQAFEWQAFARGQLARDLRSEPGLEHIQEVRIRIGSWRNHGQ